MVNWHNPSGQPLSSATWLEAHHRAKLIERTAFVESVVTLKPKRVVDLGCGTGHWLDLFAQLCHSDCELIGLDVDATALKIAEASSRDWHRAASFRVTDIENECDQIPEADVFLAFNIFPYLVNPKRFLEALRHKTSRSGTLIVRQYDGGMFRFGPMEARSRMQMEASLWASTGCSNQFHHYDLDRVFEALCNSEFVSKKISFESFSRIAPYSADALPYLKNSLEWTIDNVGSEYGKLLQEWSCSHLCEGSKLPSYFTEVDLVAWMS